jgi:hypothetical protein
MLLQNFANQIHSARHRLFDVGTQFRPDLEVTPYHAKQPKILEMNAGGFCGKQSFRQAWLVGAQSHSGKMLPKLPCSEGENLARLASAGKRVEQNHYLASCHVIDKIEGRRADVEQFDFRSDFVFRLEASDRLRTEAIVLQQNVAYTCDQHARHRFAWNHSTFTCAIGLPSGS